MGFDSSVRRQFPFVGLRPVYSYLDSAATTQQPQVAIDAVHDRAMRGVGGVHRGLHRLSNESTDAFEETRKTAAGFIGATHTDEIVFTNGTTMSINLVAHSLGQRWGEDDAVVVTELDHHSNITPWLALRERRGVDIRWIGTDAAGHLKQSDVESVFRDGRVRLLAVTGQSNVLGVQPDLPALINIAHAHKALVCVDAAQLAAHSVIDVQALDCDFLALSGHKIYGPTGIGLLYGKRTLLADMPPFMTGGGMVRTVTKDGFVPADAPARFEGGSPNLLGAVGLGAALTWQKNFAWNDRIAHEKKMIALLLSELRSVKGVRILGPADHSVSGCVSFIVEGIHPHDVAEILGNEGVCVRAGHHCAQPLHEALGINASIRASVGIYTNHDDIHALKHAIVAAQKLLLR